MKHRKMMKKGKDARLSGHRDGTGIPPSQFSGKKPGAIPSKGSTMKAKKSREMRLEGKAL